MATIFDFEKKIIFYKNGRFLEKTHLIVIKTFSTGVSWMKKNKNVIYLAFNGFHGNLLVPGNCRFLKIIRKTRWNVAKNFAIGVYWVENYKVPSTLHSQVSMATFWSLEF